MLGRVKVNANEAKLTDHVIEKTGRLRSLLQDRARIGYKFLFLRLKPFLPLRNKTMLKALKLNTLIVLLVATFGFATSAQAKKVSNHAAADLISQCNLAGGTTSEPEGNGLYTKCCSKSLGYCIICRQDGTGKCNKTSYSVRPNNTHLSQEPNANVFAPEPEPENQHLPPKVTAPRNND